MARQRLDDADIEARLADLVGWQLAEDRRALSREFSFPSFRQAFGFMTEVALAAEKLDHHPEWWNVYRRVSVRLTTHDAQGLTELDFRLATIMDRAASARSD